MSGGVDSSVAAALLVKAGFDVTGAFMVNYDPAADASRRYGASSGKNYLGGTCWQGDYQDALRVAAKLGIPLLRMNFVKEYKKMVLDSMYREYERGRTPNPDVLCNKFVKFGAWLKKAKSLGFDYMATGHYARLKRNKEKGIRNKRLLFIPYSLLLAKDIDKDQTYFLHQLNQLQLRRVLFPIGEYTKSQVRALAKKFELPTANKEESMGICFIGEVPMKKFLMKKIKLRKGKIITSSGEAVGIHDGLAFYTIGERVGMNIQSQKLKVKSMESLRDSLSKPLYVVAKNIRKNELVVGNENDPLLFSKEIHAKDINWIAGRTPKFPLKCEVRLRHRQPLQKATVGSQFAVHGSQLTIWFEKPQRAVTPGQFAVFYKKGECLGGGVVA